MSISRRQFIVGTAAGLILPSYYDKALAYLENHGEPLIEVPRSSEIELIAIDWGVGGLELNWGDPHTEPPEMTVREFAIRYFGSEEEFIHWRDEEDVDFDAGVIRIRRAITRWEVSTPKNGRGRRVAMSPGLASELFELFACRRYEALARG